MDARKAEVALRACLETIETSQRPGADLGRFFDQLSRDPDWSSSEVMELQLLLIKNVVDRWRGPDSQ